MLSCADGTVRPLSDVPEEDWDEAIRPALSAIETLWMGRVAASFDCPDGSSGRIGVTVKYPALGEYESYAAPPNVDQGPPYRCPDAAAGKGELTIDGLVVNGVDVAFKDVSFPISIRTSQSNTLVAGAAESSPDGSMWQHLLVDYGIDRDLQWYGALSWSRSFAGGGEGMRCEMTEFRPSP